MHKVYKQSFLYKKIMNFWPEIYGTSSLSGNMNILKSFFMSSTLGFTWAFEYKSGTVGAATAQYHHYLFDITMFTRLGLTGNANFTANAFVEAYYGPAGTVKTGASGYVFATTSGAETWLMQTEGSFAATDVLKSSVAADTQTAIIGSLADSIIPYNFGRDVKSLFQDTSPINYTANVICNQSVALSGEITSTAARTAITGKIKNNRKKP